MKIRITERFKKCVTLAQMPIVRQLIQDMKEDECEITEYVRMAVQALTGSNGFEIYRPVAEMAFNCRVDDRYFDGSGKLDVWISFLAFSPFYGAVDGGVYLTDIWELCEDNKHELRNKMYFNIYKKVGE